MKTALIIIFLVCHGVYINAQKSDAGGYVNLNGGVTEGDMPFGIEVGGLASIIAVKGSYTYSNSEDVLSLEAGPILVNGQNWKLITFFGVEIDNEADPKIGAEVWRRIDHIYLTLRGETFGDRYYASLGFSIPLTFNKDKPKRFF